MVIHVKDEETDALVRELAESRGISLTTAIREAAREAIEADRKARVPQQPLEDRIRPLLERLDRLPRSQTVTDKAFFDELWES